MHDEKGQGRDSVVTDELEDFQQPPHALDNPDLIPSSYQLFSKMVWLITECFSTNEGLMNGVENWLDTLTVLFFYEEL